jgi:arsenate reductase-like glutaredoxin family protein
LEANNVTIVETIPASRKLQKDDAIALLKKAGSLTVAKGKKVREFKGQDRLGDEAVMAMLGSTGNLRAPTAVVGKRLLVGFNEETFSAVFG